MLPVTRQFDAALGIVAELRAAGYEAYLAGGCVRDLLLGREPKDYDVATSATPEVVLGMFPRTFAVGARFGVVLVASGDEREGVTEVATFRSDGWAASGWGALYGQRRGGCAAAGFHHQWAVAGPGKAVPSGVKARFFGGAECTG
jgi:tRNA nucleotidyltransferase/poly(A) polymerase